MKTTTGRLILVIFLLFAGTIKSNAASHFHNYLFKVYPDTLAFEKYINTIPYGQLIPLYHQLIKMPFDDHELKAPELYPYASKIVKRLESFRDHQPEYLKLSASEWITTFNLKFAKEVLVTHIQLLSILQKDTEAFNYSILAEDYLHYSAAEINTVYAILLDRYGYQERLKEVLLESMYQNQGSPEIIGLLARSYQAEHRPDNEFSNYLQSLKNRSGRNELTAEILKKIMNNEMPQWNLYDVNGKLVQSKDLFGKTVVLDFWATWSFTAKASFPGMKLALDKYKNDPDVLFLFVDTEEKIANYKTIAKDYLKEKDYPFQVLFDEQLKHSQYTGEVFSKICKTFKISEIPQKLIIDPKGKLRFITTGQAANPEELADEISAMVNYAKSGK
ncbi:TlpA disulfide reductase family protein [Pedobacter sp. L105]|uniref:TlpA family protein disulfide reductase n=1 Tax=Pedobacter sp. L105 TaxID=1641871 RepID=UPI00131C7379|nr:TlpA disulfide reductase family protein [Pedobacter sp. L105]